MQKTVLITGCSSGIGLESALELKRQGFRVLAACRKPDDVARMSALGLTGILLDLDSPDSVERAADEVIALTENRLFGIFNNAGYGVYGPLTTISRAQLEQQFSTNFFGAHQLTLRLLPAMLPHGEGRIVMTSSVMGLISTPGRGAYAASKYALEAWSDALRMELRYSGIKVSLIEPGPIRTRFTDNVNQTEADRPVENPGIAARFTLGPEAVVEKVRHAFLSDKPKMRYPVTVVTHVVMLLKRLLPGRMMDKILQG
ncbi:SDR family oxidoreductase [[Enterobacter] lignolyticus]|uniref:Short-chain dehydrogenase/reductase SDR n=1 Tax=Enterobacter lignolyticus (strain SCF1) TaxID=701347 RepID=E3G687_ENTLS|nr:SDR family oxidoreductase [[Enterobacter] lignolyticus]ADO49546.1 short-chain dehydrogenase/reductase SDR [[Enterobacter] lignolyticus SCF1]